MTDFPAKDLMAEYTVVSSKGEHGGQQVSISHDPCVWHVEIPLGGSLARLVSLAFEHRIVGCRTPNSRRR